MDKLEINYKVKDLSEMTPLVASPNLSIQAGLNISIILGSNVLSIENHKLEGNIKLDGGAVAVNGEWVHDLGYTPFLFPLEFLGGVVYAKLG